MKRASELGRGGWTQPDGFSRALVNTADHTVSEDYRMCTGGVPIYLFPVELAPRYSSYGRTSSSGRRCPNVLPESTPVLRHAILLLSSYQICDVCYRLCLGYPLLLFPATFITLLFPPNNFVERSGRIYLFGALRKYTAMQVHCRVS